MLLVCMLSLVLSFIIRTMDTRINFWTEFIEIFPNCLLPNVEWRQALNMRIPNTAILSQNLSVHWLLFYAIRCVLRLWVGGVDEQVNSPIIWAVCVCVFGTPVSFHWKPFSFSGFDSIESTTAYSMVLIAIRVEVAANIIHRRAFLIHIFIDGMRE